MAERGEHPCRLERRAVVPARERFGGRVQRREARTGREVGRYATVSHEVLINATPGVTAVPVWAASGSGLHPSRTTIDGNYDMWVANRTYPNNTTQQSITKVRNNIIVKPAG